MQLILQEVIGISIWRAVIVDYLFEALMKTGTVHTVETLTSKGMSSDV